MRQEEFCLFLPHAGKWLHDGIAGSGVDLRGIVLDGGEDVRGELTGIGAHFDDIERFQLIFIKIMDDAVGK